MRILAIESSGQTASAAVVEGDKVLAEFNMNNKLTHSQTLLPMIDAVVKMLELDLGTVDAIAVAKGPGSFTGLRIGASTAKGLGQGLKKPLIPVSSLAGMAYQLYGCRDIICPMMDARREQVYTGLYEFTDGGFVCVADDEALPVEELAAKLNELGRSVMILGDGVPVYEEKLEDLLTVPFKKALSFQSRQRAAALGSLAAEYAAKGMSVSAADFVPEYMRKPQAEREREEKLKNGSHQTDGL